ncbi:MAG: type II toxin-antitoxin system RelE family toxin [Spirochaetaceae bacterium]
MYTIQLTEIAARRLRELDAKTRGQILNKIQHLADEPLLLGKALTGPLKEYRTLRAAGQRYRIIYKVEEQAVVVIVVTVGIRKDGDRNDVYELMKKYIRTRLIDP